MANVTNLSKGSKGDDVVKLQNALIEAGYDVGSTGADGSFGSKTLAAVKQYQKDNGLQVDGIAGKNTLGSLYGTTNNNNAGKSNGGSAKPAVSDPVQPAAVEPVADVADVPATVDKPNIYGNMTEENLANYNNLLTQAYDTINQLQSSRPGAYVNGADYGLAQDYLNQYQNRDPFSYDFNSDALYNQYKDQYIQQGQMAMMDTMGQAAAMTGGYGNSYAQSVGQQTYNQYLSQLNEIIPELYDRAYNRYNQEGQDMLNMYDLYMGREQDNYNKYLDSVDLWNSELSEAKDNYSTLYNEYTNAYDQNYMEKQDTKEWEYKEQQDAKSDKEANYNKLANLIQSAGYEPTAAELNAAGMTSAEAKALKDSYTKSITSTGSNGSTGGVTSGRETKADQAEISAITKEFERCQSADDLLYVVNDLIYRGYGETWVKNLAKRYDKWTNTGDRIPITVPVYVGPNSSSYGNSAGGVAPAGSGATGGGAGGTWYLEVR